MESGVGEPEAPSGLSPDVSLWRSLWPGPARGSPAGSEAHANEREPSPAPSGRAVCRRGQLSATGIGANSRSADAKVHRPDELEARWEKFVPADTSYRDDVVLEWLPERLEHRARELRDFVEKQHAAMRECAGMSLERERPVGL